jgi:hypothetical protein
MQSIAAASSCGFQLHPLDLMLMEEGYTDRSVFNTVYFGVWPGSISIPL